MHCLGYNKFVVSETKELLITAMFFHQNKESLQKISHASWVVWNKTLGSIILEKNIFL
jgi:hypothetical protein